MFDIKCSLRRTELIVSELVGVWWSKKASRNQGYQIMNPAVVALVLMKVSSGSALIIDKKLNDAMDATQFARGK